MKIRRSVRRAIAWVVAVTLLAQTTACSYVPARLHERTCEQEKAEVLAAAKDQTSAQDAIFFNAVFFDATDGRRSCAIAVPKGNYDVRLVATWSDGEMEEFQNIVLDIKPGRQYSVLAHETGVGYVPATAVLTGKQSSEDAIAPGPGPSLAGIGKAPLLAMLVIVVAIPIFIVSGIASGIAESEQAKKERIRSVRLAMNCCHVWIEDAMTRETIAGTAPTTR